LHFIEMVLYFTTTLNYLIEYHKPEKIMLRLTRTHKSRVSNRLAIIAALMLVTSAVVSIDNSLHSGTKAHSLAAGQDRPTHEPVSAQTGANASLKRHKSFKMSLFLLRLK